MYLLLLRQHYYLRNNQFHENCWNGMYSSWHFIYCKIIGGKAMGTYLYCILPFIAWVASGVLKFLVNYLRSGKDAFRLVGNGGFLARIQRFYQVWS